MTNGHRPIATTQRSKTRRVIPAQATSPGGPTSSGLQNVRRNSETNAVTADFNTPGQNFNNPFQIPGTEVYLKVGGYVKVDFIHDFDPIEDTDQV